MTNKVIDYDALRDNIDTMINVMEYDGMRSPGKVKFNAATLKDLLALKSYYADCCKEEPVKKTKPTKEG